MKTLLKVGLATILGSGMIIAIFAFILNKPILPGVQEVADANSHPFPELLLRTEALKQTAEWQSNVHRASTLHSRLILNPRDAEAILELARIYSIEARVTGEHGYYFPAILKMLDQVLCIESLEEKYRFEATALKANVLLSQHRFAEGLAVAEEAYAMNPYNAQVFAALVDAHVELGDYERAVELTDQMMQVKPGLMAYARASYLRELHGDLDGAVQAMQLAVEAGYPGFENTEWCRVSLAELYEKKGDKDNAELLYQQSLRFRTNNPFAQAGLAGIMRERGEFEAAETLLRTALATAPEIGFQEDLCRLYKHWGKEDKARNAYDNVIEMIEDDAAHGHVIDLDYARILLELAGDHERALQKVRVEYLKRPDNIDVNLLLAHIYMLQAKRDLATMHLTKATGTGFSNSETEELRGQLSDGNP